VSTSHPEGFFALFKPSGLSSAGALRVVKGILSADKAGFLGTLDVPAMGVLPVAIGSATKLISFLPPSEKEYVGELVLGITTITDDMEGEVIERRGATGLEDVVVKKAIESVTAQTEQVPPHVSAKHQDGVRGYKAMRGQGRLVDFAPVPVMVQRFSVLQERQDADLTGLASVTHCHWQRCGAGCRRVTCHFSRGARQTLVFWRHCHRYLLTMCSGAHLCMGWPWTATWGTEPPL
jgi:tRNA pseudouridine55 synthase